MVVVFAKDISRQLHKDEGQRNNKRQEGAVSLVGSTYCGKAREEVVTLLPARRLGPRHGLHPQASPVPTPTETECGRI